MRSSLLAAAVLASLAAATAASADPGFFGTSGLMLAPTAEARPRGDAALGANFVSARYRGGADPNTGSKGTVAQYVAVSLLDNVECAFALMNLEGKLGIQRLHVSATQRQDGWNVDRSFHVQALVHRGQLGTPSVAVGVRDIFGEAVQNRSVYAVVTQPLGVARLTAGYGSESLGGVFVGLDAAVGPLGRALVEHVDGHNNFGLRRQFWGGLQADLALMGGHSLAGGLSWHHPMY